MPNDKKEIIYKSKCESDCIYGNQIRQVNFGIGKEYDGKYWNGTCRCGKKLKMEKIEELSIVDNQKVIKDVTGLHNG